MKKEFNFGEEKIDAHVHFNGLRDDLIRYGIENGFNFLSINTDIPFFPSIDEQEKVILKLKKEYPSHINYATTFSCKNWGNSTWLQESLDRIKKSLDQGAIGVKIWKNIGMSLKDETDNFVLVDHASFDPIYDFLSQNKIPLLGHIGEPKNCWLPLDKMTVDQDRKYFAEHPEFHMYRLPHFPDYLDHINARDTMLSKHPNLRFVGLHLSSQEWETNEVAKFLDTYPNAMVDLAERICHLQHQTVTDWEKVRDFMIKYQDRIIYGSDVIDDLSLSEDELISYMDGRYKMHWDFFTKNEAMSAPKVSSGFNGLGLPMQVVRKIYTGNASGFYSI